MHVWAASIYNAVSAYDMPRHKYLSLDVLEFQWSADIALSETSSLLSSSGCRKPTLHDEAYDLPLFLISTIILFELVPPVPNLLDK